ncbi:rapid alkalinization factor-like [Phragmites australis]|uniref:rapid alkalinization factor-like n=1 Tax=Phragmites australis TaxID=29695 RepID=UPI002D79DD60|nr:rapid alkalinization factor-like [Phragmites australis]
MLCSCLVHPRSPPALRRTPPHAAAMAAAKPLLSFLLLILLAAGSASASALPGGGGHLPFTLLPADPAAGCRGSVGECLAGDELGLGEEGGLHHGRVLYRSGYISYGALRRDSVPCSRRGASYYNCRPGAQANPYHRGCSRITRCRG